ncbi:MAG TPA: VWA domain-containing protein [Acidobacteriaceae bacterium]
MRPLNLAPSKIALLAGAALLAGPFAAYAQMTGQNKTPDQNPVATISVASQLVIETVTAKDKSGKIILGLTKDDFVLTEDGVAQKLSYAEYQHLPEDATPLPPQPAGSEDIKVYNRLAHTQITAETPGEVRYKDKRLMALYFDMTTMPPTDQMRALAAAEKFVRQNMTASDLVSIMRYAGSSVDVLQDFTDDRNKLLSILETLVVGEGQGDTDVTNDSSAADTGAAFGQDSGEFNIFTTDRQLSALQTAAQMLAHLNEKKTLLYFASGLNLNGLDNQAQLKATEDAAIKAGVVLWALDARGLVATPPMGDATRGSPGGQAMYTGASAGAVVSSLQRSQDTLYSLATDTGGKAFLDNNDLAQGIVQAQRSVSDYYILGYYTSNHTLDGKFRKIKVTLNNNTEAKLDFRQGYYAGKQYGQFNGADKERQLEDALMQQDPVTDLTIGLEINYFQLNRAEYYVPVMMKIPGSELVLAKKRGASEALIDFVGEIKDDYGGTTVTNIREHVPAKLSDKTAEQLAKVPIEYSSGYTLLPGKYTIKVLARDDQTGHIGTFQTSFIIPNLNKETARVAISSVVLSGERSSMNDAIYNATKGKEQAKNNAADPLIQNGMKLIPSVTRVFNKSRNLYVYLQAYQPSPAAASAASGTNAGGSSPSSTTAARGSQPLIGFVTLYQGGKKVFETQPEEVSGNSDSRLNVAALNFAIDLNQLAAGKYDCQVTVLDPTGHKSAFWQTPIMLTQ